MQKDFDGWNEVKKGINDHAHMPLYHEREIWWCKLGTNVGFEQDGTGDGRSRPVLVVKGFSRQVCFIVPLTTSQKKSPYHIALGTIGKRTASAIISQLRLIDTKRLHAKIDTLDKRRFTDTRTAVRNLF